MAANIGAFDHRFKLVALRREALSDSVLRRASVINAKACPNSQKQRAG